MKWHESKPQVSGRERYPQTHFCRFGHRRRGTAEENAANEKFTTPFRRGLENQAADTMRCRGGVNARTRRPQTLAVCRTLLACGTAWSSTVEELSLAPARRRESTLMLGQYVMNELGRCLFVPLYAPWPRTQEAAWR